MSKNTKPNKDGHVPMQVINQLNEHTAGGFILFHFNSETGAPEQIMTFDSPAHCLALQKHIEHWLTAVQDLSIESEKATLMASSCSETEGEDDVL